MTYVLGSNKILSIKLLPLDPWMPLGCLTSNTITETTEMLNTTTRDNLGGWSTSIPGLQSYTIPFAGVQTTDQTTTFNIQGVNSIKQIKRAGTRVQWKIEDVVSGEVEIGDGYITDLTDNADAGDFATYEGVIQGYGQPVDYTDTTPPTAPVLSFGLQSNVSNVLIWTESFDDIGVILYKIYRDDNLYATVDGSTLTYEDFGILNGLRYAYNVSAVDSSGNESQLSNRIISGTTSRPGDKYLEFESVVNVVLLLESNGSPLLLETST